MIIKAINLDFYGTLVDWMPIWRRASKQIVEENNLNISSEDFALKWRKNQRILIESKNFILYKECIKLALLDLCKEIHIKNNSYEERLFSLWKGISPFTETKYVLNELGKNHMLGVCSNSSRDFFDICMEKIQTDFHHVLISDETKFTKPHHEIYELAINSFDVTKEEIIHVASSQMDIRGAKNAGLKVCWINRNAENLNDDTPIPDYKISNLKEILTIIN